MSLPQGVICIDYNISQDNPNKIYFKRDFEAFTKNPMITSTRPGNIDGAIQLAISEKRNYTFNDLLNVQIGKKRNSDNKYITFTSENIEKKGISINGDEDTSNYKNPSLHTDDREEGIERVIVEFSYSLNNSGLSHSEKKIQEKNRSVLVKRLLGYYKTILSNEDKVCSFLGKLEESTKERAEDLKIWLELEMKYAKIEGMMIYLNKALGRYIALLNKFGITQDSCETKIKRDPLINENKQNAVSKIKKYFELLSDYLAYFDENSHLYKFIERMNFNLIDIKITSNLIKKRLTNKIKNLYRRWKVDISDSELEKLYFSSFNEYFQTTDNSIIYNVNTNNINNINTFNNNNMINTINASNVNGANSTMNNPSQIEMINPLVEMNSNAMLFNNLQSYSSDFLNDNEFHNNLINNNTDFFKAKTSDDMGINRCLMVQFPVKSYRFKVKPFNLKDFPQ